jgi:hypothetical protein
MRFTTASKKYDYNGKALPKGKENIQKWKKDNYPNLPFDSLSEWRAWCDLSEKERKGEIQELKRQVTFELVKKGKCFNNVTGKTTIIRSLCYVADFTFIRNGQYIVLDCKGWKKVIDKKTGKEKWSIYKDDIYQIKKKLFIDKYPNITFEES